MEKVCTGVGTVSIVRYFDNPNDCQQKLTDLRDRVSRSVLTMLWLYKGYDIEYRSNIGELMEMLREASPSLADQLRDGIHARDVYQEAFPEDE